MFLTILDKLFPFLPITAPPSHNKHLYLIAMKYPNVILHNKVLYSCVLEVTYSFHLLSNTISHHYHQFTKTCIASLSIIGARPVKLLVLRFSH